MTKRIAMWSGPRNLSTAMMRSFSSRQDCFVTDEPFYAAFLQASGIDHPMRAQTLAQGEQDPQAVAGFCLHAERPGKSLHYQKHMTHHMLDSFDLSWMDARDEHGQPLVQHAFLIRSPARVIASYARKREQPLMSDLGFAKQLVLFERLQRTRGQVPVVIHAETIVANPAAALSALCAALGLDFDLSMLAWQRGPHADDGVWGQHWYDRIWASSGFEAADSSPVPELPPEYQRMAMEAAELQAPLEAVAVRAGALKPIR